MLNFQFKRIGLQSVALGLLCCSCNGTGVEVSAPEGEVTVQLNMPSWAVTRAEGEMLSPISVLLVPEGGDEVAKVVTVFEGTEFSVTVPEGSFDMYAVCGLPAGLLQSRMSENIEVPEGTDFAVGHAVVEVVDGVCSPSTVSITAERQMARLDLTVTGVPQNIQTLNLYVKDLCESYSIGGGWTAATESRFTQVPLERSGDVYEGGGIMIPCADESGITYVVEATTAGGYTTLLTYTADKELSAGVHLVQTLAYSGMMVVEGGLGLKGWNEDSDSGALAGKFSLNAGDQYFSQAATVVNVSSNGKSLNILAHRPMTVTLDEVKRWDTKYVPYTLAPEIKVLRWALPTSATSPSNVLSAIEKIGWDAFAAQFASNGLEPIDRDSKKIIAYRDKGADKFYVYDFQQYKVCEVLDESGEFLYYPLGIVQLSE